MKNVTLFLKTRLVLGAIAFMATSANLQANAATFQFSFRVSNNGSIRGTGLVGGLSENGVGQSATSVTLTTTTVGFGLGEYVGNPFSNTFDVVDGVVTRIDFVSFGRSNSSPAVTDSSFALDFDRSESDTLGSVGLTNLPNRVVTNSALIEISLLESHPSPSVPESSNLVGLITLGGLMIGSAARKIRQ
ncbi:MAG: hypothetical protein AB4041_13460 [Microcystaceae cyanobacterium]